MIECRLTLEEMAFGCEREVNFDAAGDCVNCDGAGREDGDVARMEFEGMPSREGIRVTGGACW